MTDLSKQELYDIPIQKMNLPVKAYNSCIRTGLISVGDCVDALQAHLRRTWMYSGRQKSQDEFLNEVLPALIEQGYWTTPLNPRAFTPEIIDELKQKLAENGYWIEG